MPCDPGISRPKKLVSLDFEGHTELFGPHPFTCKIPTPPEGFRTKKFVFGFLSSLRKIYTAIFYGSFSALTLESGLGSCSVICVGEKDRSREIKGDKGRDRKKKTQTHTHSHTHTHRDQQIAKERNTGGRERERERERGKEKKKFNKERERSTSLTFSISAVSRLLGQKMLGKKLQTYQRC